MLFLKLGLSQSDKSRSMHRCHRVGYQVQKALGLVRSLETSMDKTTPQLRGIECLMKRSGRQVFMAVSVTLVCTSCLTLEASFVRISCGRHGNRWSRS